jgi:hypothetical protein
MNEIVDEFDGIQRWKDEDHGSQPTSNNCDNFQQLVNTTINPTK